jgi:hypothetical protein
MLKIDGILVPKYPFGIELSMFSLISKFTSSPQWVYKCKRELKSNELMLLLLTDYFYPAS